VLKLFSIKRASLFCSLARGEESGEIDVDILVEFEAGRSLLHPAGLEIEPEETLGRRVVRLTYN